jgi:hypothetical protein
MFDTVTFRRTVKNPRLDAFSQKGDRFVFNPPHRDGGALPHLTFGFAPDGVGYLSATVSLPKMLFDNNVQTVSETDLPRLIASVSAFVSEVAGVRYDAGAANVARLDVCHNFPMSEESVQAYLLALRNAHYPRMVRNVMEGGTVNFTNPASTRYPRPRINERVTVYSKLAEVAARALRGAATAAEVRAAVSALRIEHRFGTGARLGRLVTSLRLPDRTAESLLCASVWEAVMGETISKLGVDKHIESGDSRLDLLRERFGVGRTYQNLAGFLALLDKHGVEGLLALGYNRETFRRNRKKVQEAGAWLINPSRAALPPLRLVRTERAAVASSFAKG